MRRATRRRAALWTPFKRTLKLQGLRLPESGAANSLELEEERMVNAQADVFEELHRHWSPTFQRDLPEHLLVEIFLDEHPVVIEGLEDVHLPDSRDLQRAARRA
eukprot:2692267-Pyramimonas_sp.AAC.1